MIKTHRGRLVVDVHDPVLGRIRMRVPADQQSPRRAAAFERTVRAMLAAGQDPRPERREPRKTVPTLAAFWPDFVRYQGSSANKRPNKPATLARLDMEFRVHLTSLHATTLDQIDTLAVDRLTAELEAKGLARGSVKNVRATLRRALAVAKRWRVIAEIPEIEISNAPIDKIEADQWLTRDEADALIRAAGDRGLAILVAIRTGLRIGELLALRWCDVDLAGKRIHVRRQLLRSGEYGPPKNGRSREVPIPLDAAEALADATRDGALVFGGTTRRAFVELLERARDRAEISKHVHPHMTRHTYASHCVAAGIPTRVLMAWGGWSSEAMLARYAHLSPRDVEHWADRISAPLGPRPVGTDLVPRRPRNENAALEAQKRRFSRVDQLTDKPAGGKQK